MPDDLDDLIRRAKESSEPVGGPTVAEVDPLDDLIARAKAPADDGGISAGASINVGPDRPEAISGAFRKPVDPWAEKIAASKAKSAAEDAAFPVNRETRASLLRLKDPPLPDIRPVSIVETFLGSTSRGKYDEGPSDSRTFAERFPNIKTQEDADFALAQMYQSKRASRTAEQVSEASVSENIKDLPAWKRGLLNTGSTLATFGRAATGGYFGGLIGNGERQESAQLDKLNAALEDADGWTKYLHAGGEGIGAGVGIGGLARGIGIGKAMATYGAVATPGGVKERVLGAGEMAAFGKIAQFLTPSTQKMLARLPETLRGPVIAKAIDLADEFAGGVFSEASIRVAKGEDVTAEALVFSGFLNAAQASLRKVVTDAPPAPDAPPEAPARPVEAPMAEVVPEATPPAAEPVAEPVASDSPVPAPEARPADPRKMADDMNAAVGGKVEDLLSGPATLTRGEQDAVRGAWSLLSRAIGEQGTARDVYERSPEGSTRSDMAEALRTIEHVYDLRVRRGQMPASEADTSLPGAGRPALPEAPAAPREEVIQPRAGEPKAETPPPVEPPAPKPVEPAPEPEGTSLMNRVVSAERVAHGQEPLQGTEPQTKAEWEERARKIIAAKPNTPDNLIREVLKKPRSLRPEEDAILRAERVNRNRALEEADAKLVKAIADGDADAIAVAKDNADAALAKRTELDEAGELAGAEWGRGGVARQQMAARDHSLASILADFQRADASKPVSDADRAEARDLAGKVKETGEAVEAHAERKSEIAAKKVLIDVINENRAEPPAPKDKAEYGAKNKGVTREAYEAAKAELKAKLNRLNVGIPVDAIPILGKMAAFHIEAGARSFSRWAKSMKEEWGDAVEPHLRPAWDEARKSFTGKDIEGASASIAKGFKSGKSLDKMAAQVGRISEAIIRSGVTSRGEIITKVHDILKAVDPAITRRETMDAISGYGNVRKLDKDPVKVRLREIKGELQQGLKLKDMANDQPPLKSGPQRQAPGDEQRGLIRLVNEAKRRGGYDVRDPESQLRSALDGFRTRMRNSIADMRRQMKSGKKDVPNRTKMELKDPADVALKAEHEAMVKSFQEMFGKPGMTEAQRVEAAIKATEKAISELEGKVKSGDVFAAKGEEKPVDPRLAAARATRDALREQAADIRASALQGQRSPSEAQEQARKRRLTNQIAFLENAVATGNLDAKPRRAQPPMDAETIKLVARHEQAIKARHEAVANRQLANMNKAQRLARAAFLDAPALMRVIKTTFDASLVGLQGGFRMAVHPIKTARAAKRGFGAMGEMSHAEAQARIANDPDFLAAKRAKLALGGVGKTNVEEFLRSRWADKIPVVKNFQRFSTTFMNEMRMDAFKTLRRSFSRTGHSTPKEDAAIANFVNVITGRGGGESRALDRLNEMFFAPRWTISRFQTLLGTPMMRGNTARTRAIIATEYARMIGGLGVVYGLASAMGAEVDTDQDSPNVGSITIGDSRVDPLFGLGQAFTFLKRAGKSMMGKGAASEDINPDFMEDYVRGKLAPIPGAIVSRVKGTTLGGEEATAGVLAGELTTPLVIGDIKKVLESQPNPATAAALSVLSWFGARVKEVR